MESQTRLPWTSEEDAILIDLVQKYGEKRWNMVANGLPGRTGKGCSHRWRTYLRPDVKHPHLEPFTEWEAAVIVQAQREMGNNWLAIAKLLLPGRSNTAVKNFWHCRLKSGSGTHTNRFIVENYNLRYLLNEVEEKDRLHPVALPAFPSTAPTGHVRRQIHPRPRQEAAAQAAAYAEAQLAAAQMAAQAQAMGMDVKTYMQQQGMMDPYAGMYGTYDAAQMAMAQEYGAAHGAASGGSFTSKEELKQQASAYVQQQLAIMGHPPSSRHASGGGSSSKHGDSSAAGAGGSYGYGAGWQQAYGSQDPANSAAAAAGGGVKKSGRGRGRPPGSKSQQAQAQALAQQAHSNADTGGYDASAVSADPQLQAQLYHHLQQHQHSMRLSHDETATWCSSGMMLAGSAAAAAAMPVGSPGGPEVHSSATYSMSQGGMQHTNSAAAGADPMDPAALAAAPVPLEMGPLDGMPSGLAAAAAAAGGLHHHPASAAAAAGDDDDAVDGAVGAGAGELAVVAGDEQQGPVEVSGLLPTSAAAAAAEFNTLPPFRVSMTGLDFELEAANGGAQTVRFSARTLKLFDCEEGAGVHQMPGYKASIGSMDFRTSLTSFDEILGNSAVNRMSDHTHIALRGPSWDGGGAGGASPDSTHPSDVTAAAAAAAASAPPGASAGGAVVAGPGAAASPAAAAATVGYACTSSEADNALAAAFRQQQQRQPPVVMPPPSSGGGGSSMCMRSWIAAQQPPNSAAAAAALAAVPVGSGMHHHHHSSSLGGVQSGSFSFPAAQEEIHPGAIAAPAGVPAVLGDAVHPGVDDHTHALQGCSSDTPFGELGLQATPFSPVAGSATAAAVQAEPTEETAEGSGHHMQQLHEHVSVGACVPSAAECSTGGPPPPSAQSQQQPLPASGAAGMEAAAAGGREPPSAPRMPPAFHSVLQALQPPAAAPISSGGGNSAAAAAGPGALAPPASAGMTFVKAEPQQQQMGCESALAAASPAITGLCGPTGNMPPSNMAPAGFFMPAVTSAGEGYVHSQQQQQHHHMMMQQMQHQQPIGGLPMPMPLPPQLLLPSHQQHYGHAHGPSGAQQRISDLPLPSPIDLFHGDHGLHNDDLLIDATEVFDESMLQANHQAQLQLYHQHQLQMQMQQHKKRYGGGGAGQHGTDAQFARVSTGDLANDTDMDTCAAAAATTAAEAAAALVSHISSISKAAGASYYSQQQQQSTDGHNAAAADGSLSQQQHAGGVKRRRSSSNGAACNGQQQQQQHGKRHRPSEGSLVDVVYSTTAGPQNGTQDCLEFWHD